MPLRRLDAFGHRFYLWVLFIWQDTKLREIYGVGMIVLALGFVAAPRGSLLNVVRWFPGLSPFMFAVFTATCGYLLAKYGYRSAIHRFVYSLPLLLYIIGTIELTVSRWPETALAPSIIYTIAYIALIYSIGIQEQV